MKPDQRPLNPRRAALGFAAGWIGAAWIAHLGVIRFQPHPETDPYPDACTQMGYAKIQDYFWYAVLPLAALAGAWMAGRLWRGGNDTGDARGMSNLQKSRPVSVAAILGCFLLSAAWMCDPWLSSRVFDILHEGLHLLTVQAWLSGGRPGLTIHSEYAPLYDWTTIWWLRSFGVNASSLRWYFYAAQVAGTTLNLILVQLAVRGRVARVAAGALILLGSTAATTTYGWANALRSGWPLAAVVIAVAGPGAAAVRGAVAGALLAISVLYSHEYGIAGVAALLAFRGGWERPAPGRGAPIAAWGVLGGAVTLLVLGIAMFGPDWLAGLRAAIGPGYGMSRLSGNGSLPLPVFRLPASSDPPYAAYLLLWLVSLWAPPLVAAAAAVWRHADPRAGDTHSGRLVVPLAVFLVLAQVPGIARPYGSQILAIPAMALLAGILTDAAIGAGRVQVARLATVVVLAYAVVNPFGGVRRLVLGRWGRPAGHAALVAPGGRFGTLRLDPEGVSRLVKAADLVRRLCPGNGRVFVGGMRAQVVCFLADRAPLGPYPDGALALTDGARQEVLDALDRERPAVALMEDDSLDVSSESEHPEQWRYLRAHYRVASEWGTKPHLSIFVRNGGSGPRALSGTIMK